MLTPEQEQKINSLINKFTQERKNSSLEIKAIIEEMASFKGLKESQMKALSLRQRLLESMHTLLEHQSNLRKKYRAEKSKQMIDLSNNHQQRYQYNEKTVIIEGLVTFTKEKLEQVENQISFYVDSMKTVDNILFGIKTRVEIEKVLGL